MNASQPGFGTTPVNVFGPRASAGSSVNSQSAVRKGSIDSMEVSGFQTIIGPVDEPILFMNRAIVASSSPCPRESASFGLHPR